MGIIWNGYLDATYYGDLKAIGPNFTADLMFYLPLWTEVHCICHFVEVLEILWEPRRENPYCAEWTVLTDASPLLWNVATMCSMNRKSWRRSIYGEFIFQNSTLIDS